MPKPVTSVSGYVCVFVKQVLLFYTWVFLIYRQVLLLFLTSFTQHSVSKFSACCWGRVSPATVKHRYLHCLPSRLFAHVLWGQNIFLS